MTWVLFSCHSIYNENQWVALRIAGVADVFVNVLSGEVNRCLVAACLQSRASTEQVSMVDEASFIDQWDSKKKTSRPFVYFVKRNLVFLLTFLKNALTNLWKGQGEFSRLSWLALLDIIWSKPLYTAGLIKTSVMFQTDCVPMHYAEPTLIFCLHIPFSPLKCFWKERFTAFIISFCLSVSLKRDTTFPLTYMGSIYM